MKNTIFYGLLAIYVFFLVDWSTIQLLKIAGMNIYYGDIFFFLILATAVWSFAKNGISWRWIRPVTAGYLLFLAWLVLEVFWGWRIYGYRALGEARYVLPFFAFFIPYFLLADKRSDNPALVGKYVRMTTYVAAAASLLFLICSLIYREPFYFSEINLQNQKIWLHKLISSDQSFHIILLAMFIFFLSFYRKKFFSLPKIIFFLLIILVLPVNNRTALISSFAALLVLLVLAKKFREILFAGASVALIFALIYAVPDIEYRYYPVQSRQKVFGLNIEQVKGMQTVYWRLYQNKAALREILKKPFFGHHLGGYFNFFIPETNQKNTYPPHNQYILILLKTGMIGLVLMLVPLLLLLRQLFKFLADERLEKSERSTVWLLLLVLLAQLPYGMGFGFIPLYAVYFGFGVIFSESLAKKYAPQLRIGKT
ncbi:MAG: O-antigen ligase family protein [Candidatus Aminicenantes bacterium]|nr:O-antigen ligase family protein [Candidatus Aminicenantes bacterium]